MEKAIEQLQKFKKFLLKELDEALTHMYEYDYKDNMHSVYHGEVLAIQRILHEVSYTIQDLKKGDE